MSATGRGSEYIENGVYLTPAPLARALVALVPFLDTPTMVLEPSVGGGAFVAALLERERRTRVYHRYQAIDVDPMATGLDMVREEGGWAAAGDFLTAALPVRPGAIVGNPPFAIPQPARPCATCAATGWRTSPRKIAGWEYDPIPAAWKRACQRCDGTGSITPAPLPVAEKHMRRCLDVVAPGGHVALLLRLAMLEGTERREFWLQHPARKVWPLSRRPSFTGSGSDATAYGWFWWTSGYTGPSELGAPIDWDTASS
jgi:hypothetical protein